MQQEGHASIPVDHWLSAGEQVHATAAATDSVVLVTDQRLLVVTGRRAALDVDVTGLRRIQFDVEKRRPATMVIVPEDPTLEAQVLTIPPSDIEAAAAVVAQVGLRLQR